MEAFLLVTASVALLTRLVGLMHGLVPRRRRPRTPPGSIQPPRHRTPLESSRDERWGATAEKMCFIVPMRLGTGTVTGRSYLMRLSAFLIAGLMAGFAGLIVPTIAPCQALDGVCCRIHRSHLYSRFAIYQQELPVI
jgi:hypothetical protein